MARTDFKSSPEAGGHDNSVSRGWTHNYSRSAQILRSRAVVVGCNYPKSKGARLWGACSDARSWAQVLTQRLGIPPPNLSLLVDETPDGRAIDEGGHNYPSQRAVLERLTWLCQDAEPGDLLVFIFCGRGTLVLDGFGLDEGEAEPPEANDEDDERPAEEGLLCADFASSDWVRGYTLRILSSATVGRCWEHLPPGCSLTLVLDAEHCCSMLPVERRLDSALIPESVRCSDEPIPVLEALLTGVSWTLREARASRAAEADQACNTGAEAPDPRCGGRGPVGQWPQKRWLRGLWEVATGEEDPSDVPAEVQAFAFAASGPGGRAFEAHVGDSSAAEAFAATGKARKGGPAGRRGLLTHCLLMAMEELNFQGSCYALWWRAVRVLRREGFAEQQFQLTFADGADPTAREIFEPVTASEAKAYTRRATLQARPAERGPASAAQCCAGAPPGSAGSEVTPPWGSDYEHPPISSRGPVTCGCGVGPFGGSHDGCAVM